MDESCEPVEPLAELPEGSDEFEVYLGGDRTVRRDQAGEPEFAVRTRRELGMFEGHVDTQNMVRVAMAGDTVWGVERDDFDVEYVVRYELRRASGGQPGSLERDGARAPRLALRRHGHPLGPLLSAPCLMLGNIPNFLTYLSHGTAEGG